MAIVQICLISEALVNSKIVRTHFASVVIKVIIKFSIIHG